MMHYQTRPIISSRVLASGVLIPITETSEGLNEMGVKHSKGANGHSHGKKKEIDSIDFDRQNPTSQDPVRISRLPTLTNSTLLVSSEGLIVSGGKVSPFRYIHHRAIARPRHPMVALQALGTMKLPFCPLQKGQ